MASVHKRQTADGVRYDVRYRTPDRKVRTKTFARKVDADRFARTVEVDKSRGDWTDPRLARITFADWWDTYQMTVVDLRPSTRARDESYARNHVLPRFGDLTLDQIDHMAVRSWVADLSASDLAPATVQKAHQILAKCLRAAVAAGRLPSSPAEGVPLPRIEREEMRFLTPDEVATLADEIDPRYRALVILGAYSGLRLGELAGLTRERVDLLHRRVDVAEIVVEVRGELTIGPPKTRAGRRSVPLPRVAADALAEHLGSHDHRHVFPAPAGGPMRAGQFRSRFWLPAVTRADLAPLRIHDLRHTAVAFWIAAGASPKEIAVRAGHGSVSVVLDRYGHLLPGREHEVNDALDALADAAKAARSVRPRDIRAMDA